MSRVRNLSPSPLTYRFAFAKLLRCFRDHSFSFRGNVFIVIYFRGAFADEILNSMANLINVNLINVKWMVLAFHRLFNKQPQQHRQTK